MNIVLRFSEEESYSASENQKWRIRKDFEDGKVSTVVMLGYKRNRDGVLEIIPEEAETVKMIFADAMTGMGGLAIANTLNELHISTKNGCQWTAHGVRRVLRNEKYCGDLRLQKFYNENHLTKRKMTNAGKLPQIGIVKKCAVREYPKSEIDRYQAA